MNWPALIADIGGTNARFAIIEEPGAAATRARNLVNSEYGSLAEAISAYCEMENVRPLRAAIAAAGPQTDGMFRLTNRSEWDVPVASLIGTAGLERVEVLNDFEALALSLPHLGPADVQALKPKAQAEAFAPMIVAGPGTGLGMGGVIRTGSGWQAVPSEGGHVELGHRHDRPAAVLELVRREFGRVSAERVLCGSGLSLLHRLLGDLDGLPRADLDPAGVTDAALAGNAPARDTVEVFCSLLASYAGDMALVFGARGGAFIGGGIILKLLPLVDAENFARDFRAKGRLSAYLDRVPVNIITNPLPALIGCAASLEA